MAQTIAGHGKHEAAVNEDERSKNLLELVTSVFFVALFGAIGGILSYYAKIDDGAQQYGTLWAAALLGSGAGFVGVYVFTKDPSVHQAKTLALALAFGLTWKPVLAGIDSWTSMQLNQQNAATVSDAAAKLELAADHYLRGGGAAQRKASESGALSKAQQDDIEQLLREAQAAKSKMETLRR